MIKRMLVFSVAVLLFTACQSNTGTDNAKPGEMPGTESAATLTGIPYRLAENYFVKNDAPALDNPKIETAERFNEFFGMGRTMSENSKPTEIDFSKEFVLAVILPQTDVATSLEVLSVQKDEKKELVLTYRLTSGEKQSFTTVPFLAVVLNKTEFRSLVIREEK